MNCLFQVSSYKILTHTKGRGKQVTFLLHVKVVMKVLRVYIRLMYFEENLQHFYKCEDLSSWNTVSRYDFILFMLFTVSIK